MKFKGKRGVSYIFLLITIFVIIILAGTVIYILDGHNTLEKAKEARLKTNVAQVIEEVNEYLLKNMKKPKEERYPVTNEEVKLEDLKMPVKEFIAKDQGLILNNDLPDVDGINKYKVFYIDPKIIESAKAFKKKIILSIGDKEAQLYFNDPEIIHQLSYHKLEDILFGFSTKTRYFTGTYNTFKVYPDGTLTAIGKKGWMSGATDSESDELYIDYTTKYKSPMGLGIKKEVYGNGNIFGIKKDGKVIVLGDNRDHKLGSEETYDLLFKTELPIDNVEHVYPGINATFVVKKDGTLWAAGLNSIGQLSVGNHVNTTGFRQCILPPGLTVNDIKDLYNLDDETYLITKQNKLYASGEYFAETFKEVIIPEETSKIKKVYIVKRAIGILYESGNFYTHRVVKEEFITPKKSYGEFEKVLSNVKTIPGGDKNKYQKDFFIYLDNDNKLWIQNVYYKDEFKVEHLDKGRYLVNVPPEVDVNNMDIISIYRMICNGKLYSIRGSRDTGYRYQNDHIYDSEIVEGWENHEILYVKDKKNNIYIKNLDLPIHNKKYIQENQRKIITTARYLDCHLSSLNLINGDYNYCYCYNGYKDRISNVRGISKIYEEDDEKYILYRNGYAYFGELVKDPDASPIEGINKYYKWQKYTKLDNIIDMTSNDVETAFCLRESGNKKSIYWRGINKAPFKTNQTLLEGSNHTVNFELVTVPGIPNNAKKIYGNYKACFLLTADGDLYSYGYPNYSGFADKKEEFRKIDFPGKVAEFKAVTYWYDDCIAYCIAVLDNGDVYAWGDNNKGQFGDGYEIRNNYVTPVKLNITDVETVGVGYGFAIYQKKDGKVYGAGRNEFGQLGTGDHASTNGKFVLSEELTNNDFK